MNTLVAAENGFWFKGVWQTEETSTDALRTVLNLCRAISNHRVAFHFGVSGKAVKKLRTRSDTTNGMMLRLMEEAKLSSSKPVQCREHNWRNNYPGDTEARKALITAEEERERQQVIRHEQQKQRTRRAISDVLCLERIRAQRHEAVQRRKWSGLTQVLTAGSLSCSLNTVRRYW